MLETEHRGADGPTGALVAASLAQRSAAQISERQAREVQSRQRRQALNDRIRALGTERERADQEAQLADSRVALARRSAERYRQLAQEGFVADSQAQVRQEELIDTQLRAQAARRNAATLAHELMALRSELAQTASQWDADAAQLDRALALLDQEMIENAARRRQQIVAPQPGTITAIHLPLGATVQAGQTVATLSPHATIDAGAATSPLEAHLYAPSRAAGFVAPGQAVWIRFDAFPYQKFGMARGEVVEVAATPVLPDDLPPGQAQALLRSARGAEPLYRIRVRLKSGEGDSRVTFRALKTGMGLQADVVQDMRRVWEWVLEPLLSIGGPWRISPVLPQGTSPGGA